MQVVLTAATGLTRILPAHVLQALQEASSSPGALQAAVAQLAHSYNAHVVDWVSGDALGVAPHEDVGGGVGDGPQQWTTADLEGLCGAAGPSFASAWLPSAPSSAPSASAPRARGGLPRGEVERDHFAHRVLQFVRESLLRVVGPGGVGAADPEADPLLAAMRACVDSVEAGGGQSVASLGAGEAGLRALCEYLRGAAQAGQATCRSVAILAAILAETDVLFAPWSEGLVAGPHALQRVGVLRDLGRRAAVVCAGLAGVQWASHQKYYEAERKPWDADLPSLVAKVDPAGFQLCVDVDKCAAFLQASGLISGESLLRAMCRAVLAGSRDAGMGAVDIAVGDVLLFLASEGSPLVGHVELAETEDGDKYQWGFAFDATAPIAQFLLGTRQYDLLHTFATRRLEWGDASTPLHAQQYALSLALSLLHQAQTATGDLRVEAARAVVDDAVVWFHRGSPQEARAQVAYHLHIAKLFERTGFDAHALSGLETALLSERSGVPRVETVAVLLSRIFNAAIARLDYDKAFLAARQNPNTDFSKSCMERLVVVMTDDGATQRLCSLPFSASEVALVWSALLWKGWMAEVNASPSPAQYFHALFAFMTARLRHRQAAAAMWALYFRLSQPGAASAETSALAVAALSTACASLSLVPREQAYLLGRDWWPRCPEPLSLVTVDDIREALASLLK